MRFVLFLYLNYSVLFAQSVEEMFYDIPDVLLGSRLEGPDSPEKWPKEHRKKIIKEIDVKNGYILLKSGLEVVKLTRKSPLSPILLVSGDSYADGASGLHGRISIFTKDPIKKKWIDLTGELAPNVSDLVINALFRKQCSTKQNLMDSASGTYMYKFPRVGRVFKAIVNSDVAICKKPLFELQFVDQGFEMMIP